MLVIGIILGNLAVLVVGKGQLVVLRTVDNALLDSRIHLTESHGGCRCSEGIDHGHAGRALLNPYLLSL